MGERALAVFHMVGPMTAHEYAWREGMNLDDALPILRALVTSGHLHTLRRFRQTHLPTWGRILYGLNWSQTDAAGHKLTQEVT